MTPPPKPKRSSKPKRPARLPAAGLVALAATTALPQHLALADGRKWTNPAGGTFSDTANWQNNTPPGSADQALFDLPASDYTVSFANNPSNDQLNVNDGHVTFDLNAHTYTLTETSHVIDFTSVNVAQDQGKSSRLTVTDGTLAGFDIVVGSSRQSVRPGGNGTMDVPGGGTVRSSGFGADIGVGYDATGTLNVTGGGKVIGVNLHIAAGQSRNSSSSGTVNVSGAGSELRMSDAIQLGNHPNGVAALNVSNGGYVFSNQLHIGRYNPGRGSVIVEGPGTRVDVNNLLVGASGNGDMVLRDGAMVTSTRSNVGFGGCSIGYYNNSIGTFTVTGAGTKLALTENLDIGVLHPINPGDKSTGTFRVAGGGPQITVGNDLGMGAGSPSLSALIDASGLAPIQVSGQAALRGTMEVALADTFAPASGHQYTVLTAGGGITGSLSLTGPAADRFLLKQAAGSLSLTYAPFIQADATGDNKVTVGDLGILATHFGEQNVGGGKSIGDFNLDRAVTVGDLGLLATYYGQGSTGSLTFDEAIKAYPALAAAVPEPTTLTLILLAGIGFCRRRRVR